jgi:hypothetical protein
LTGHLARLEAEGTSANFQTNFFKHHFTSFLPQFTGDAWFRYEISVSGDATKGESREENGAEILRRATARCAARISPENYGLCGG